MDADALSLGWRSGLGLARFDGEVRDGGDHAVCRHGFAAMGLETLVMVADPSEVAIGIESVGFVRGASGWQLERAPEPR